MKKTGFILTLAIVIAVLATGCDFMQQTPPPVRTPATSLVVPEPFQPMALINEHFTIEGIPQKKFMVGGGIMVQYKAPSEGNLYWVEETGRRILMTKYLQSGELFEEVLPIDDTDFQRLCGDMSRTRFVLYFIPSDVRSF